MKIILFFCQTANIYLSFVSLCLSPLIGTTPNSLCGIKIKPSKEWQSNPTIYLYICTFCLFFLTFVSFTQSFHHPAPFADADFNVKGSMATFHIRIVNPFLGLLRWEFCCFHLIFLHEKPNQDSLHHRKYIPCVMTTKEMPLYLSG